MISKAARIAITMGIFSNCFIRTKEEKLKGFRYDDLKEAYKDDFSTYKEYLPLIEKCYAQDLYWHGTGRYHYRYDMNSREEEADRENVFDVLESIVDRKAVLAHQDLFVNFDSQAARTVSLTLCRMYARCYAEIHQYESDPLRYEYGTVRFWAGVIVPVQMIAILRNNPVRAYAPHFKKIVENTRGLRKLKGWISTFRKDFQSKRFPLSGIHDIRSDVVGNHGILLAFKKGSLKTVPFDKAVERFEARVAGDLPLGSLSHIEVPVANLDEVKQFLESKNVTVPVIPIEFGERYCNRFSLKELIG